MPEWNETSLDQYRVHDRERLYAICVNNLMLRSGSMCRLTEEEWMRWAKSVDPHMLSLVRNVLYAVSEVSKYAKVLAKDVNK